MIGSRLETDAANAACRLAFYGRLVALVDVPDSPGALAKLRLFRLKARTGSVERVAADGRSAICKGMFKRDTDISRFAGLKARSCSGARAQSCSAVCHQYVSQHQAPGHLQGRQVQGNIPHFAGPKALLSSDSSSRARPSVRVTQRCCHVPHTGQF